MNMLKEYGLTPKECNQVKGAYADLEIQAMIFDMAIDIETWSPVPKRQNGLPAWIGRWRAKEAQADQDPYFDNEGWE